MTIILDEEKNIIQLIMVGKSLDENAIEVGDIELSIVRNIFDYKYIDGEFILKDTAYSERLEKLKQAKIKTMSQICNEEIIKGVTYGGERYSLTLDDQTNISNLTILAVQGNSVPYHADGRGANCKIFTAEEFIQFSSYCQQFKIYHLTYFNQLKGYINSLTNTEDILSVNYGDKLTGDYATALATLTNNFQYNMPVIQDKNDYTDILIDIDEF